MFNIDWYYVPDRDISETHTVYAVDYDKNTGKTTFLVYDNGWEWIDAKECKPYNC